MKAPNLAALKKDLKDLQGRMARLENRSADDDAAATRSLELLSSQHAMREALLQFTQEIATREGIPVDLFVSRFEAAKEWHRDRFLQMVEKMDPHTAAEIDDREIVDIPTEDLPPCIFPE